jgi:hypothetical protein
MPRKVLPLSDTAIRNTKPAGKAVKMFDGGGLYIEVTTTGGKLWRLKYRFDDKEKLPSFGAYPAVGLMEARERAQNKEPQRGEEGTEGRYQVSPQGAGCVGAAYNRTKFLKERRAMMQAWADHLDGLRPDADVIPLRTAG